MFARLKKKIVEEEGVEEAELSKKYVPGSAVPQRPPDGSPVSRGHRGSAASLSSHGSSSSLNAQAENKKGAESNADSLQAELTQRSDQIRRLEGKLDEYSAMLKETVKAKEKLEIVLEKQQEANTKRVQEMNEEFQLRRSKMADKLALAVQRKEDEMKEQIQALEKEKSGLKDQFQRVSLDKFKKQEESEELQGFQVQELAKVKHMFVNSQEELHKCKADLDHAQEKLEESNQQAQKLATELNKVRDNVTKLRHTRDELIKQKASAEEHGTQQERSKKLLEERLHSASIESQEKSKRLVALEERLNQTQEELEALRHDSEVHKTQSATQLHESESTNKHLEEKVRMLEQRLQDHSLTDDEQMQAVMAERDTLEQKLEASRRELIDVKSSSADVISSLEQQISHLNTKMAEDTEEAIKGQQTLDAMSRRHSEELSQLQAKLDDAEQQAQSHLEFVKQRDTQIAVQKSLSETELRATQEQLAETKKQSLEMKKQLQDKIATLESKITGLSTATDFEKSAAEHKITRLESQNEEYLEREIEHEKHITQLEDEKENVSASLNLKTKECEQLTREVEEIRERTEDLSRQALSAGTAVMDAHKEVDRLRKLVEARDTQINKADQENEELKRQNLELANSLAQQDVETQTNHDQAQRALFEKNESISVLKQTVAEKEEAIEVHQSKIKELEAAAQADTNGVNEAEDIEKLKQTLEEQEQQLSEKNKTIKMQQQRLADLKKTLQRELKIQNSTGYDSPEEVTRDKGQSSISAGLNKSCSSPAFSNSSVGQSPGYSHNSGPTESPNTQASSSLSPHCAGLDRQDVREVNFQYLRHVVFKFMSSTDSEAKQLLKAVSTLLEFTPHEEKLINKTLEWKTSWFGIRPSPKKTIQVSSLAYR
ncbi:golgin subfamily A member 1-like [Patiria miniata]|uniref:GRIP domain-containing protein n=1 Tax=Patiria miniata TaxID=46514 RepID=A0A913Z1R4_PATMI|nr:golgin subfamily A member 1-like [Patiria miniata]